MNSKEKPLDFDEALKRLLKSGHIKQDREKKNTKDKPSVKKPLK
jgi:hypothetical protein